VGRPGRFLVGRVDNVHPAFVLKASLILLRRLGWQLALAFSSESRGLCLSCNARWMRLRAQA
jgi:hypothetical protein